MIEISLRIRFMSRWIFNNKILGSSFADWINSFSWVNVLANSCVSSSSELSFDDKDSDWTGDDEAVVVVVSVFDVSSSSLVL